MKTAEEVETCVWESDIRDVRYGTEVIYWCVTHDSNHIDDPVSKCCGDEVVDGFCNSCGENS